MVFRRSRAFRVIGAVVLTALTYEIVAPVATYALTGGPAQPEFSKFESVTTNNMVDEFTGAFTYNLPVVSIPGPTGSGYSLSLSYHSGTSPEEEASWVGYGWTLSPGAITRQKRGLPDDYNGSTVKHWNKTETNWTLTARPMKPFEIFSFNNLADSVLGAIDTATGLDTSLGVSGTIGLNSISYNSQRGFGYSAGTSVSLADQSSQLGSLNYSVSDGVGSFDPKINVGAIINHYTNIGKSDINRESMRFTVTSPGAGVNESRKFKPASISMLGALGSALTYPIVNFGDDRRSSTVMGYNGVHVDIGTGTENNPVPIQAGPEFIVSGSYSEQTPVASADISSYGYIYSATGKGDVNAAMDYAVEKEATFTKRDRFLAIPYSQPDNYTVSGEGVSGGFRAYHTKLGDFHPNAVTSKTLISTFEGDINIGWTVGLGGDFGLGRHSLSVSGWPSISNTLPFSDPGLGDAGCFFRYYSDPGGTMTHASDDKPVRAAISGPIPGLEVYFPNLSGVGQTVNRGSRVGRSSYIGYHTNREMLVTGASGPAGKTRKVAYSAYSKDPDVEKFIDRKSVPDGVGEFGVTAANGNRYVYGLPVYARNEKNLQYGLYREGAVIDSEYIAYKHFSGPEFARKVVGEERNAPYATTYLLTQITTPDYVDRTGDGPSKDDFGGYTKFNYRRVSGTTNKIANGSWYKWRVPYRGMLLQKNAGWDPRDDMGMVMMGEREVYYLESIETKTHVAYFVTNKGMTVQDTTFVGSGEERKDAYPAQVDEGAASENSAYTPSGSNPSEKLERIELWSKTSSGKRGKLLQTTYLDYSYELSRGMPNAALDGGTRAGKLTLKKLWTEYEGTHAVKISPYIFGYSYRTSFGTKTTARYPAVTDYGNNFVVSGSDPQNPAYSYHQTDRWGYYQYNGASRHDHRQDWVAQNVATYGHAFDPAAWQLKWIRLPSGGEIHVQYEQNDYMTVQDRPALAMVKLTPAGTTGLSNRVYLDAADLGITSTCSGGTPSAELRYFVDRIRQTFLPLNRPKVPVYFKFLYDLMGYAPSLKSCGSDFISGYVLLDSVGIDNLCRPYVVLKPDATGNITNPHQICLDYVHASGVQSLRYNVSCEGGDAIESGGGLDAVAQLLARIGSSLIGSGVGCALMDTANCYLRVPMTRAKLGGGIRVKRLVMYDSGIEDDDDNLYGSEYIYQTEGGVSSGVATNEPSTGREENALVTCIEKRDEQAWLDRAIAGRDREQFEGPFGESFLPAPTIGYSRVVVKGINGGKTGKGFVVNEFFTAKDYPYDRFYSDNGSDVDATIGGRGVEATGIEQKGFPVSLPLGFANFFVSNLWMSQGYRFILNGMHGQPKGTLTYGGDYADSTTWYASASTTYNYFEPGQKIPVMYGIGDIRMEYPGREMEITSEGRTVSDELVRGTVEGDVTIGLVFPPTFGASIAPKNISFDQKELRTYVTTKVVRYPVVVRSVTTLKDGIKSTVENVGFNPETGQPIATRTYDGFNQLLLGGSSTPHDGSYTAYSLPASWPFKSLGQKAGSEHTRFISGECGADIDKRSNNAGTWLTFRLRAPAAYKEVLGRFTPGDFIRLTKPSSSGRDTIGVFTVSSIDRYRVNLIPTSIEAPRSNQAFEQGVTVDIISSGKSNELQLPSQNVTTYGLPLTTKPTKEALP